MTQPSKPKSPFENSLILSVLEEVNRPVSVPELAHLLGVTGALKNKLQRHIAEMAKRGLLLINRQHQILLTSHLSFKPGRVVGHRDGFGFVIFDNRNQPDAYLSNDQMRKVMHGDRVVAKIVGRDHRDRPVAEIVEITERARHEIAGVLKSNYGIWVVEPDHPRIRHRVLVNPDELNGAKLDDKVIAAITEPPSEHGEVRGRIERVLRTEGATLLTDMAIASHGIPNEFSAKALRQARRFNKTVELDLRDTRDERTDWRHLPIVTIDGEDARDFDDAVCAQKTPQGYTVWVAIADVSHYVEVNTALDADAQLRATSVYFPDRVVPMLPEELSNHLCSLMPKVDRLALGVVMQLSDSGELKSYQFSKTIIHSAARLTYTQVGGWIEEGFKQTDGLKPEVRESLQVLHEVYRKLVKKRAERGALEFDAPETKLRLDAEGEVLDVIMVKRNDAHKVIEECMILANIAAARYLAEQKMPCLYRVHAAPQADKMADLQAVLASRQIALRWSEPVVPMMLTQMMRGLGDRPDRSVIETLVVRSLPQAVYQPENIGHFGLALSHYAHFTSPIRRYPDLLVHRAIAHRLRGGTVETFEHSVTQMVELGELSSQRERRADEATRDVVSGLKCRWLKSKVGEEFDAHITGVVEFGLFVQLEPYFMDGLIHISTLGNEYFEFHGDRLELRGEISGKRYGLGDKLKVRVASVDERDRKVDVVLASNEGQRGVRRSARHSRRLPHAPSHGQGRAQTERQAHNTGSAKERKNSSESASTKSGRGKSATLGHTSKAGKAISVRAKKASRVKSKKSTSRAARRRLKQRG